jgi:hypothetical protein
VLAALRPDRGVRSALSFCVIGIFATLLHPDTLPAVPYVDQILQTSFSVYVAMEIDSLPVAYARQIAYWPARARNTKTPTLYFEDARATADAACVKPVLELEVPLELIAGTPADNPAAATASKKITAEVERRLQQGKFRVLVGDRCNWRCVVSGVDVRQVLEAAHLPGRDWRLHNDASDGVMLRSDLHRLMDLGLARIHNGKFEFSKVVRTGDYAKYHGREIQMSLS